jgi:transcriptional regulator with XRE-family HTH domain
MTRVMARSGLISAAQCRAARALLEWTQSDLAQRAGSIRMTVVRFERGYTVRASTRRQFREAFEQAGLQFMPSDAGGGEGVVRQAQPFVRRFAFDRDFYLSQAQLIAWLAQRPANRDIRIGLLSLAREYQGKAQYAAAAAL